jgi:alkanesulfonate monooxygenase SsuD/methylene tetrahydromethanopterin reductase-like flavin-dependent oxidoreductase (luciferase family)
MITAVGAVTVPGTRPPPVLLAALGTSMLRLAGESADGTVTWMTGRRTLQTHVVPVITAAAAAPPRIVAGLPVTVTGQVDDARERIDRHFAMAARVPEYRAVLDREGVDGPGDVAIVGDEEAVARQVELLAGAGVTDFAAAPFGTAAEQDGHSAGAHHITGRICAWPPG